MDKAQIEHLPDSAGVYIFKDKAGNILYIGKARSLRKRVRSYFTRPQSLKTQIVISKLAKLDYMISESEAQARLQEAKLIKEKLPPYNTALRDDKSFPFICISDESFPVVWIARQTNKRLRASVSRCFGPYTNAAFLRAALKSIRHIFGFRSCFKMPKKPCLYYRLGLCPAPCNKKISVKEYKENIRNIVLFLEGKQTELISKLRLKMRQLANQKRFEQAAGLRNQIQALSSVFQQGMPSLYEAYSELTELRQVLGLPAQPLRIEAFDVSNISGSSACASLVSFYQGSPDKSNYRRFRIKGVLGIDDYQMLEEAVDRRYRRLIKENLPLPDLVVIDGGKGQLNKVKHKLKELNLAIPLISIAKQQEEIFLPNQRRPLRLKFDSPALHLIQRVRDEAHRFALAYHHVLRRKKTLGR